MPLDPLSRYRNEVPQLAPDAAGVEHPTIPARWVRVGSDRDEAPPEVVYHTLAAGESYETLAHRFLGSSAQWWRIADVNPLIFPFDLVPGMVVAIPALGALPGLARTRDW